MNDKILNSKISKMKTYFQKLFTDNDDKINIRDRKLFFKDIFYFSTSYISDMGISYTSLHSILRADNKYNNVSKTAFLNKKKNIDAVYFEDFNKNFYNYVKTDMNQTERLVGVDGSQINLLKSVCDTFNTNKNNTYTQASLSSLHDIDNDIPIHFNLSKSFDERQNLIEQLQYLNKNDILVADRGYYSSELVSTLLEKKINFVFRIKKNINHSIELNKTKGDDLIVKHGDTNLKIIKYLTNPITNINLQNLNIDDVHKNIEAISNEINLIKININTTKNERLKIKKENKLLIINNDKQKLKLNRKLVKDFSNKISTYEDDIDKLKKKNDVNKNNLNELMKHIDSEYYILTNLTNYKNDKLREIYKKRWGIETSFYFLKDKFNFRCNNSKDINLIRQNLYSAQFMMILIGYIQYLLRNHVKNNRKINKTNAIMLLNRNLLDLLIYNTKINSHNTKKIVTVLIIISVNTVTTIITVHYNNRIRKRPVATTFNNVVSST